jgi:transcriptional regulator with XRE-family HTH domain
VLESIGQRLRDAREAKGIGVRELARRISVSPSFVSQVELGRANPSLGTLYSFVSELSLSLDDLMLDPEAAPAPTPPAAPVEPEPRVERPAAHRVVQTSDQRPSIGLPGVTWERLTPDDDPLVDFLYVTYQPGGESCPADSLMRHGGREYGYVLEGGLEVQVGFETFDLAAGDSIAFDSTIPHRLHNPHPHLSRSIWSVVGRRGDPRRGDLGHGDESAEWSAF